MPFGCKFGPQNQNCQFKLKFGTWTNLNIHNWMVLFTFSIFDRKYPFLENLVQKIKIPSLSWNSVQNLIGICRIGWWFFFFFFCLRPEIPFLGKFGPKKITILSLSWNLVVRLIWICRIQCWCSPFSVFDQKYLFQKIWS